MGAIHVHEFMSLDGVIDAPTWTFDYGFDLRMGEAIAAVTARSRAILPGRNVVSGSLTTATWSNSTIIGPYGAAAIRGLKGEVDGDLYVSGSGTLVRALLADGLVDELHLFVYPLTRGSAPRLFPDALSSKLSFVGSEAYDNGVVYLVYRPQA